MSRNKASPFTHFLNQWNKEFGSMKDLDNDLTSHVGAPRFLIELTGDILKAIVLNTTIMYSLTEDESKYFYKSLPSWERTTTIKRRKLERIMLDLEQENLIITQLRYRQGSNVKHFKVNKNELISQLQDCKKTLVENGVLKLTEEEIEAQKSSQELNNLPF